MKLITTVRIIMVVRKKSAFYTHQEVPNQQGEKTLVVLRQPSQMHLQGCQSYKPFFGFCIPFNHEICLDQKLPEGTHPLSQATVVLYPICPQPSFDYCISAKALTYIWVGQLTRAFSS